MHRRLRDSEFSDLFVGHSGNSTPLYDELTVVAISLQQSQRAMANTANDSVIRICNGNLLTELGRLPEIISRAPATGEKNNIVFGRIYLIDQIRARGF